ncbi:MAG: hypothetical protein ACOCWI_03815, partial [Bacillota bacterium]
MKNITKKLIALITLSLIVSCVFLFTACSQTKGRLVEEDTIFYINRKESSIKGISLNLLLHKNSAITLRKDGTATIHLRLMDGLGS